MSGDSNRGKYRSPEGSATWEYVATASCSLLIFLAGCTAGWTSPTLAILMRPDSPVVLTSSDASTLSSMIALGHILSPMLTIVMANRLGRKYSLLASGVPMIINWGLVAVSQNLKVLLVARFIAGLSFGLILCFPPMYLGEIASAKLRGTIGMACSTMMNSGILCMFIMVPYFSVQTTAYIYLSAVTVAVMCLCFIPESPYFLAMIGKIDEAESALEKLRGKTDVTEELDIIKTTVSQRGKTREGQDEGKDQNARQESSALKQLFTVPGNRKAILINILFIAALQFGSYIAIMIYGQIVFEKMKTGVSAYVCTTTVGTLQLVFNILTAFVIDRLGRRPLICISGVTSGACVLVVGVYFYLMEYAKVDVTPYATIALCAVFLNVVALSVGLTPLQQVIQSEILATEVKELATCVIGTTGGVFATISIKSYLMVAETWNLGHSVPFIVFAANTWIITAIILKLLPETKGKTLYEIQKDLNA